MIDFFFAILAAGLAGAEEPQAPVAQSAAPAQEAAAPAPDVSIGQNAVIGENTVIAGTAATPAPTAVAPAPPSPAASGFNMAAVPAGLVAEPQVPSGKFTTAAEVKPILNATKGNWIAVREYGGQDLIYVTHLWGWRCGLAAIAISVNGEAMQNWPMPACHAQFATPNAILEDDGLPYLTLRAGAVQNVTIQIVYDDLSMDVASFARGDVLIP